MIGALAAAGVGYFFAWWALVPAVVALALLAFYRDPPRRVPEGSGLVLAVADGKIVEVARDVEVAGIGRAVRIMTFLSVLDVHINRSPCAGRVREVVYRRGEFLSALRSEADARNESNTLVLEPAEPLPGPVRVRQIAGVLARRIVCTVEAGQVLAAGGRYGMIKLGSRTEVCLPEDAGWEVLVKPGDVVRAGRTVLARYRGAGVVSSTGRTESGAARRQAEPPTPD